MALDFNFQELVQNAKKEGQNAAQRQLEEQEARRKREEQLRQEAARRQLDAAKRQLEEQEARRVKEEQLRQEAARKQKEVLAEQEAREHATVREGAELRANETCELIPKLVRSVTESKASAKQAQGYQTHFDCQAEVMVLNRWEYTGSLSSSHDLDPQHLRYAAKTVYERCVNAGLAPKLLLEQARDGQTFKVKLNIRWMSTQ